MENRSLLYAQRRRNDAAVLKIQKQRFKEVGSQACRHYGEERGRF